MVACATLAMCLAACGSEGPNPAPTGSDALDAPPAIPIVGPERRILAYGDSLLAGYGLDETESYPAKLEAALRARGVNARIVNAGVSGETSAQGLQRLAGTLDAQPIKPDLIIVSLGGNDMLQGRPPAETRANLEAILKLLRARKVRVLLLGMLAAPSLSPDYARDFNPIYPSLAHRYGADLVPFFLQPLKGKPDLVQPDHVHPTALGVEEMVAATVDDVREALPKR